MDYMPFIAIAGVIHLRLFPLRAVHPMVICQSVGRKHFAHSTFLDAYP